MGLISNGKIYVKFALLIEPGKVGVMEEISPDIHKLTRQHENCSMSRILSMASAMPHCTFQSRHNGRKGVSAWAPRNIRGVLHL